MINVVSHILRYNFTNIQPVWMQQKSKLMVTFGSSRIGTIFAHQHVSQLHKHFAMIGSTSIIGHGIRGGVWECVMCANWSCSRLQNGVEECRVNFGVSGGVAAFRYSCFQLHLLHLCCCYLVFKLCFVIVFSFDGNKIWVNEMNDWSLQ